MLTRREFIKAGAAGFALSQLPLAARAAEALASAMRESNLIYLTPIQSSGAESRCQAEVWFVADGADMYVCTGSDSWRATAPGKGLNRARVWVGDVGVWTRADGAYRSLPSVDTEVAIIADKPEQDRVLGLMGDKYSLQWVLWGPRFRNGLEDGSRTMLRYRPV